MICLHCGHARSDHEYVNPEDGRTERCPCFASYGIGRGRCGCTEFETAEAVARG